MREQHFLNAPHFMFSKADAHFSDSTSIRMLHFSYFDILVWVDGGIRFQRHYQKRD